VHLPHVSAAVPRLAAGEREKGSAHVQDQDKAAPQSEIRKRITRFADDARHLFKDVLPALDRFEALQAGTQKLLERIADLERENEQVRRSRDELAATLSKLRELVIGCTDGEAERDPESESLSSQGSPEPQAPQAPTFRVRSLSAVYRPTSPTPGAQS
jgi:chromosome segregation ATPase